MKANISNSFVVNEPKEKVWQLLTTPDQIVTCLPGAALVETIDEKNHKGEVTLKFGPVKAKYNGVITFDTVDIEGGKMRLIGKGLDAKGKGSADMVMDATITDQEGGTGVAYDMEITVTGMLAQFGSRLIVDVTKSVFKQFTQNFKDKLASKEVDNSLHAGQVMGTALKSLFKKKDPS